MTMTILLNIFSFFISTIPVSFFTPTARTFRVFFYDFLGMRKKMILKNLTIVFADIKSTREIEIMGKKCFENFILTTLEALRGVRKNFIEHVEFENREVLDTILKRGLGAFILTWHGANWEVLAAAVGANIRPSVVPVKKVGSDQVNRFVTRFREKYRVRSLISLYKGHTTKEIIKTLKANELVGFMQDQARPGEPRMPFFSMPAKTNTSLAAIWRKHNAPVVPAYVVRTAPNRHRIYFMHELKLVLTEDADYDIRENTLQFNKVLETGILLNPEQYFWLHNRWKK